MKTADVSLIFHGSTVSLRDIATIDRTTLLPNERKAVEFCVDWINGKSTFEINTSGSTGPPKQIHIHRTSMVASAEKTGKALGLRPGMTALVCLNTGFIAGMMMLVRSMTIGMNMVIAEPSANPLQGVPPSKIDFTALVPYQMIAMLHSEQRDRLAAIGTIILGGASISVELQREISTLPARCYATFGMTETISHVALQKLNGEETQGRFNTLDGISIGQDSRGCLIIATDFLPELVVTNDLVEVYTPKEFRWVGRYDTVINSGGVKVIPEKIEKAVDEWMVTKGISNRFFVTGIAHPQLGQEVSLFVEGTLSNEDEHTLLGWLEGALGKYEVPRRVFYKGHFRETNTGKVDKKASVV